jgi:hypothetical protein
MATAKEKATEREDAREFLTNKVKARLVEPSSLLKVRTEYTRSVTDYVTVELYYVDSDGRGQYMNLSGTIGQALGIRRRAGNRPVQLAIGGGGYSKSYDVALRLFHFLNLKSEDVNFEY